MNLLSRISRWINTGLVSIAGLFLVIMISLTCANIFLRGVWVPIRGTYELLGLLGAVVTAFALGYTQLHRGHISVNILTQKMSGRTRALVDTINCAVCTVFFALAAWKMSEKATILKNSGEVTETLRIIYHPFTYGVALGCAVLAFVFFVDMLKAAMPSKRGET